MTEFKRVAVIGTGTMGPGMGATLARIGIDVAMYDVSAEALERAKGMVGMAEGVLDRDRHVPGRRSHPDPQRVRGARVEHEAYVHTVEAGADQGDAAHDLVIEGDPQLRSSVASRPRQQPRLHVEQRRCSEEQVEARHAGHAPPVQVSDRPEAANPWQRELPLAEHHGPRVLDPARRAGHEQDRHVARGVQVEELGATVAEHWHIQRRRLSLVKRAPELDRGLRRALLDRRCACRVCVGGTAAARRTSVRRAARTA